MKISIDRRKELITEEVTHISTMEEGEWRTGVPDEEVLAHGSDLEKIPKDYGRSNFGCYFYCF